MRQRGSIEKHGTTWSVRYRDSSGTQKRRSGFRTKGEASEWLSSKLSVIRGSDGRDGLTLTAWVEEYIDLHEASERRLDTLESRLKHATRYMGSTPVIELTVNDVKRWRKTLAPGIAYTATNALRQVLAEAVLEGWLPTNVAKAVKNPAPPTQDFVPFETWDQVQAVAEQLPERYLNIPIVAAGTGMRPEEWRKLEWGHVHFEDRILVLPEAVVKHRTQPCPRRIPLTDDVLDALRQQQEITGDGDLVFTSDQGQPLDLHNLRSRFWLPALKRAKLPHHRLLDLRHSFATWALAAGMSLHDLARYMGTSIRMIDQTYGHLDVGSDERAREALGHMMVTSGTKPHTAGPTIHAGNVIRLDDRR